MPARSRNTRNQGATSRVNYLDLDPTDGLPVQKYRLQTIVVNQDASTADPAVSSKSTTSLEWASQFGTPQYPWREKPLPSFYHELPAHNQEMIRRARCGNTNPTVSTWDRKHKCWISGAEKERKARDVKLGIDTDKKEADLEEHDDGSNAQSPQSMVQDDSDAVSNASGEQAEDEDENAIDMDDAVTGRRSKRSKTDINQLNTALQEPRTFQLKRWVQLPPQVAEKITEYNFLAPRRPGMPNLYTPEYAMQMFGQYLDTSSLSVNMGYDLGEGGGLASAAGAMGAPTSVPIGMPGAPAVPVKGKHGGRRTTTKKRKGGPGRRKAVPVTPAASTTDPATVTEGDAVVNIEIIKTETQDRDQPDEAGSGSEHDGSEEGEIEEQPRESSQPAAVQPITVVPTKRIWSEFEIAMGLDKEDNSAKSSSIPTPASAISAPIAQEVKSEATTFAPELQPSESTSTLPPPTASLATETPEQISNAITQVAPGNPTDAGKHVMKSIIPGLGEIEDEEEMQIVEETARAVEGDRRSENGSASMAESPMDTPREGGAVTSASNDREDNKEMDLLEGLDEAIDQGMNEN